MAITDWPAAERPRERLLSLGPARLSDAELVAVFLRSGVAGKSAVELARELIGRFGGLGGLLAAGHAALCETKGLGEAKAAQAARGIARSCVIHLSPQGRPLTHEVVKELLARDQGLILLASRYEGVDERLIRQQVDEELSIGDYVLSGGELAAMGLIDSLVRQIPGVLGDDASAGQGLFVDGLRDCPHHTGAGCYNGEGVPAVFRFGDPYA